MQPCKFTFDDSPVFDGFAHGSTWNGFDNVAVTAAERERIAVWMKESSIGNMLQADIADLMAIEPIAASNPPLYSLGWGYATQIVREPRVTWAQLREMPWGTMLVFPNEWDIYPYCLVPAGTRAVVTDNSLADAKDGCIYLLTNDAWVTKALQEWSGCVQFNPMNDGYSWDDESPVALK